MSQSNDLLYVFTGIRGERVREAVRAVLAGREAVEAGFVERMTRYPLESLAGFLLSSSVAFYFAERGVNPKIKTFVDAVYYLSTCLSVGYADIFAQTQTGRAVATLVMTLGPALTGNALDAPGRAAAASEPSSQAMIARLDAILDELRKRAVADAGGGAPEARGARD